MTTEVRTPQVGELLILDGRMRRITLIANNIAQFDNPEPEKEPARQAAMREWKTGRDAFVNEKINAAIRAGELGIEQVETARDAFDQEYRATVAAPPEMTFLGAVGVEWLDWLPGANFWTVRGRMAPPGPGTIVAAKLNASQSADLFPAEG